MRSPGIFPTLCAALAAVAFYLALPAVKPAFSEDGKSKVLFEAVDAVREQRELSELGGAKPVYGNDDRMDWGKIGDRRVRAVAAASVALFTSLALAEEANGRLRLRALTLEDRKSVV